jgi:hypothetical protein
MWSQVRERMNTDSSLPNYLAATSPLHVFPTLWVVTCILAFVASTDFLSLCSWFVIGVNRWEVCNIGSVREEVASFNPQHSCPFFPQLECIYTLSTNCTVSKCYSSYNTWWMKNFSFKLWNMFLIFSWQCTFLLQIIGVDFVYFVQKNMLDVRNRTLNIEAHNESFSSRVVVLERCRYFVSYSYYTCNMYNTNHV